MKRVQVLQERLLGWLGQGFHLKNEIRNCAALAKLEIPLTETNRRGPFTIPKRPIAFYADIGGASIIGFVLQ